RRPAWWRRAPQGGRRPIASSARSASASGRSGGWPVARWSQRSPRWRPAPPGISLGTPLAVEAPFLGVGAMTEHWSPASWRAKPAKHVPTDYPDLAALSQAETTLRAMPPLVFAGEARRLKSL